MSKTHSIAGRVAELWHYPVKSMQGLPVDKLACTTAGFELDREWALVEPDSDRVLSAKTVPELLAATVTGSGVGDTAIELPGGATVRPGDPGADAVLSEWLDRPVELRHRRDQNGGVYEMTFDPPDDTAEKFEIPVQAGSFFDLTSVHLLTTATLDAAKAASPELDWDIRRFRPNLLIETDGEPFVEDGWCGATISIGGTEPVEVEINQPTVRCAMPLRAQPGGLPRSVDTYRAMQALHANHLGVYGTILGSGTISRGDELRLVG